MIPGHKDYIGDWGLHVFCKNCENRFGTATFGNVWYKRQEYPVCPKCGASKWNYTVRKVRYRSRGCLWWYESMWEEDKEYKYEKY